MKLLLQALAASGVFCSLVGCNPGDSADWGDEEVDEAQLAQIDPGNEIGVHVRFHFDDGTALADVLVINATSDQYEAGTEYWYVDTAAFPLLGVQNLVVTREPLSGAPPALSGSHQFTQPVHLPWTRFSSDPSSGGYLYDNGNYHLRLAVSSGGVRRITWYQVLPGGTKAANIDPTGTFLVGSGPVPVLPTQAGYQVDAIVQ